MYPNKERDDYTVVENTLIINLYDRPVDICEGLDITFGREDLDLTVKGKVVGIHKRYQLVQKAAPFLQVYFQNQRHSNEVGLDGKAAFKTEFIKHHVKLPETINMERYMESAPPELQQMRLRSWELRENRAALRVERDKLSDTSIEGLEGPDAIEATWQFVDGLGDELDDTSALKASLQAESELRRSRLEQITKDIEEIDKELYSLPFDKFDTPDKAYKLFAVFVHRGSTGAGHYWIYIHDFANDIWRKYEDSTVEVVTNLAEIFEAKNSAFQGVPNFVIYVQNDRKEELTDCLHRVQPDVEMADATQNSEFTKMDIESVGDETQLYHG